MLLQPGMVARAKSESNFEDSLPPRGVAKDRVIINVGGYRHETYLSTLKVVPDSRLAWIAENASKQAEYDPENNEYFFDRHPGVFASIINYYRTGKLHSPSDVCGPLFEEELAFWGIDELQMEPCCWSNYTQHRDAQATLKAFEGLQKSVEESENEFSAFKVRHKVSPRTRWKNEIWAMLEEPYSSKYAQIFAMVSLVVIVLSVATFCMESIRQLSEGYKSLFEGMEYFYLVWFSADLLARLLTCPSLLTFFKTFMTWVDITSVIPLYVNLAIGDQSQVSGTLNFLFVLRLIRIFRLFRFFRTMSGMQVIGHTLRASARELFLLILILLIPMVIFSTLVFYAEKSLDETDFGSIPEAFWWAVITMTTVGYGDVHPKSLLGKIIGTICACVGVLIVALPVSVIGSNFTLFYSHAQAQLKLPKKKRTPILLGAAGALVSESTLYNGNPDSSEEGGSNRSPRDDPLGLPRKSLRNPSITPRCRSSRREAALPPATLPTLESDTSDIERTSNTKKSAEELFSSPPTGSGVDISSGLRGASDVMLNITAPTHVHRRMAISPAPSPPVRRPSQRRRRRGGSKRLANRGNGDASSHEKERDSYYYTTTDGDSPGESGIPGKSQRENSEQDRNSAAHESSNESNISERRNATAKVTVLSDSKTEDDVQSRRNSGAHVRLAGVTFDSSKDYSEDEKEQDRNQNKMEPAPPWKSTENLSGDKSHHNKLPVEPRQRSKTELVSSDTPPCKRRNAIGGNRGISSLPISPLVRSEEKIHRPPPNESIGDSKARKCVDNTRNSQCNERNSQQELKNLQHSASTQGNNALESEGRDGRDDVLRSAIRGHKRDNIQNMTRV